MRLSTSTFLFTYTISMSTASMFQDILTSLTTSPTYQDLFKSINNSTLKALLSSDQQCGAFICSLYNGTTPFETSTTTTATNTSHTDSKSHLSPRFLDFIPDLATQILSEIADEGKSATSMLGDLLTNNTQATGAKSAATALQSGVKSVLSDAGGFMQSIGCDVGIGGDKCGGKAKLEAACKSLSSAGVSLSMSLFFSAPLSSSLTATATVTVIGGSANSTTEVRPAASRTGSDGVKETGVSSSAESGTAVSAIVPPSTVSGEAVTTASSSSARSTGSQLIQANGVYGHRDGFENSMNPLFGFALAILGLL